MMFLLFLRMSRQTTTMIAIIIGTPSPTASPIAIPILLAEKHTSRYIIKQLLCCNKYNTTLVFSGHGNWSRLL